MKRCEIFVSVFLLCDIASVGFVVVKYPMSTGILVNPATVKTYTKYIPDRPLIISGSLGGPFVVFILTPFRNALTLASQDRISSTTQIYKKCFAGGLQRGWTGGFYPSIPAIPQFVTLGPLYHVYSSLIGQYSALLVTAATESVFTFGAHSRNAQMAFNESLSSANAHRRITRLATPWNFIGPGLTPHILRNCVGMTGIRVFSKPIKSHLDEKFPNTSDKVKRTSADFLGSLFSGILSTPFNQLFNFFATTPQAQSLCRTKRIAMAKDFFMKQYFVRGDGGRLRPSKIMMRDIALRSIYSMGLFGIYATIERNLVDAYHARASL